jgi:F-type H+-transporting ATPase subunit delta
MFQKIARRYSNALYGDALATKKLDKISSDAAVILDAVNNSRELELFFKSQIIDKTKKEEIVRAIFGNKVDSLSVNFLLLLIERGREEYVKEILEDYQNLENQKNGIVKVEITTAVELSKEEKESLKEKIDGYTGLKSTAIYKLDRNLIGGFVVKITDVILDASIKRQLELLKKKFKEGELILN